MILIKQLIRFVAAVVDSLVAGVVCFFLIAYLMKLILVNVLGCSYPQHSISDFPVCNFPFGFITAFPIIGIVIFSLAKIYKIIKI